MDNRSRFHSAIPVLAVASVLCAALVGARVLVMQQLTYVWLIVPNLLLAWIPLLASRFACHTLADGRKPRAATYIWAVIWLAFYPNASYIATDLIHLSYASTKQTLYYDVSVNMLAAFLGLLLGALSLYGLHVEVVRRYGQRAGMAFAAIVIALGAVGVYLGRVLRWNSWDLAVRPWRVIADMLDIVRRPDALLFIGSFALFTGCVYAVLYALLKPSGGSFDPVSLRDDSGSPKER